ncbi:hypothetical protein [Psychrobacter sp. DM4]|uniref:hypothetical protein n=1 Tax=Psychrobacter sp. DM4 TaxID=3440637 RepID=UPI003F508868
MSKNPLLKRPSLAKDLLCYLAAKPVEITLPVTEVDTVPYHAVLHRYQLPLGKMNVVELTLYLPLQSRVSVIKSKRMAMIKAALVWHKLFLMQSTDDSLDSHNLLTFDIQLYTHDDHANATDLQSMQTHQKTSFEHSFGARYFMEDLVVDMSEDVQQLQVFSQQDWYAMVSTLQTPCELWRFLNYYLAHMQRSALDDTVDFDSEQKVLDNFMSDDILFTQAIAIDNALINYDMQDKPNSALISMKLAQKTKSKTLPMYRGHMQQAATLWSQLIMQMLMTVDAKPSTDKRGYRLEPRSIQWQKQLLDESLFSRHELVRTLYRHPKQDQALKRSGYVVHQHSYEHLGRHYVLIFYGEVEGGQQIKAVIQPKLGDIALEVATRLPLAELHHVIVLGIDFITENEDTFMDIDLWIQPIDATTQKERQLTKQIQNLKPKILEQEESNQPSTTRQTHSKDASEPELPTPLGSENTQLSPRDKLKTLPSMQLNLSIPARKDKP